MGSVRGLVSGSVRICAISQKAVGDYLAVLKPGTPLNLKDCINFVKDLSKDTAELMKKQGMPVVVVELSAGSLLWLPLGS